MTTATYSAPTLDDALAELSGRERAEANADDWWVSCALQAIRAEARSAREFQAFDLVDRYGLGEPDDPKRWGALFARARRLGLITSVGAAPSRRPTAGRSLCRVWRGA